MRKGQVLTAVILVFSFVLLYCAVWLKEAIFALRETRNFWAGLQAKLLSQSGLNLAGSILRQGNIPKTPINLSLPDGEKLRLSFLQDETQTKVKVNSVAEVFGRRFENEEVFSFPKGIGDRSISVFWCDPRTGTPMSPHRWNLGLGVTKASLVLVVDGQEGNFTLTGSFSGVEASSLFGVSERGEIVSGVIPNSTGIFTFDGWWQVPVLPGPFTILFPFSPLEKEQVLGKEGIFRRVPVLPRFPKQYFLDSDKGIFVFSEHDLGKPVLLSGWQKGFRFHGSLYANAHLNIFGTSLTALLPSRGDKVEVTGGIKVEDEGKWYFAIPNQPVSEWREIRESLKLQGLVVEGCEAIYRPTPTWLAWRSLSDPNLGGEGIVLPAFTEVDLGKINETNFCFLLGDGAVKGNIPEGKGWVVVFCDGDLKVRGSIFVGEGSYLALIARNIIWEIEPDKPVQTLKALIWATEGSLQVLSSPTTSLPFPTRLLFVGSINVNNFPEIEDGMGRWSMEVFYAPFPFPSFLVQPIEQGVSEE